MELCYNQCERDEEKEESPFQCSFLHTDTIKMVWSQGQAVGFYVIKAKGEW